jgi:hypothetical protein
MKIRAEQADFETKLEAARQRDFTERLSKVQRRNEISTNSVFVSGSVMMAREAIQQSQQKKLQEANTVK